MRPSLDRARSTHGTAIPMARGESLATKSQSTLTSPGIAGARGRSQSVLFTK